MGETKDNLKSKDQKTQGWFEGAKSLVRSKDSTKKTAETYVDLLQALEKKVSEMLVAKCRDVENDKSRYAYHQKVLAELQVQETFLQAIIESAARCGDAADKDSGK